MSAVVMWEAVAQAGRTDELVAFVLAHTASTAQVYRSTDGRVVVIDPSGTGVPETPAELVAREPHAWPFEQVSRSGAGNSPPGHLSSGHGPGC